MITVFVAYAGDAGTRFDRDYYVRTHSPRVTEAWGRTSWTAPRPSSRPVTARARSRSASASSGTKRRSAPHSIRRLPGA